MNIAEQIVSAIGKSDVFSLFGGYALVGEKMVRFPVGHQEMERRNVFGLVSDARYHYADGSRIIYRRPPVGDWTFTVTAPE